MRNPGVSICALLLAAVVGCEEVETPSNTAIDAALSVNEWAAVESPSSNGARKNLASGNLTFQHNLRAGLAAAAAKGKPLLVFFTAHWCHYCHAMAAEALVDDRVVQLSQRFVCVLVDADAEPIVCRNLGVDGYPTVVFLSPRGQELNRVEGKQSATEMLRAMHAAFQSLARRDASSEPFSGGPVR